MEFSRPEYWSEEQFAFPGIFQTRDQTQVSCIAGGFFTSWATREAQPKCSHSAKIKEGEKYKVQKVLPAILLNEPVLPNDPEWEMWTTSQSSWHAHSQPIFGDEDSRSQSYFSV